MNADQAPGQAGALLRAWIVVMLIGHAWSVWRAVSAIHDRVTHGQTVWSPVFGYVLPIAACLGLLAIAGLLMVWRGRRIGAVIVTATAVASLASSVVYGVPLRMLMINAIGLAVFLALVGWRWRSLR